MPAEVRDKGAVVPDGWIIHNDRVMHDPINSKECRICLRGLVIQLVDAYQKACTTPGLPLSVDGASKLPLVRKVAEVLDIQPMDEPTYFDRQCSEKRDHAEHWWSWGKKSAYCIGKD